MSRKILIIEDEQNVIRAYREMFANSDIELLIADTMMEGLEMFEANTDVAVIAVDGLLPRGKGDSPYPNGGRSCGGAILVGWLRDRGRGFQGPILACSSESRFNQQMLDAGATESCEKGLSVLRRVAELLRVSE